MPLGATPLPLLGGISQRLFRTSPASYAASVAAASVAVAVTSMVPALAERTTFLLALGVIILSAWRAGWRAGAAAGIVSVLLIAILLPPRGGWSSPSPEDLLRFAMFAALTVTLLLFARARERAERLLHRTQALAHVIVDNGPVLIAGADAQGNTVMFNRACERLTGYTREEVLGKPFVQTFVPEAWQGRVIERFREQPLEVLALPHENPWVTKASAERLIEWRCFRVAQEDGAPITMGVGQDVTERHAAQVMIAESLKREEAAREALAEANARKEHFIALLAHELRTPLNAAMGWFHIFRTGSPLEAAARADAVVDRNLQMMHTLIEDIVDFNRAEFGKLTLNRRPVDPEELLGEIVTSARSLADARQIRLSLHIPAPLPTIDADPKRLRQTILNVLSNALKFTPDGGDVSVMARAGMGGLEITITDNGAGIAPDHLDRIFDPLWQPAGGQRSDGLGLGLALVKRLVEAHGGGVRISSDGARRGTEVVLTLPIQGSLDADLAV